MHGAKGFLAPCLLCLLLVLGIDPNNAAVAAAPARAGCACTPTSKPAVMA